MGKSGMCFRERICLQRRLNLDLRKGTGVGVRRQSRWEREGMCLCQHRGEESQVVVAGEKGPVQIMLDCSLRPIEGVRVGEKRRGLEEDLNLCGDWE